MIPYLSIVFSAGALFQKIREMDKNIKKIKMGAKDTETSLYTIDMRVIKLETVLDNIEVSLNVPSIQPNKNGGTTMPRKIKQIPEEFKTYEEAAEFWDTHDSTEYEDVLEEVEMHVDIQKRHYLIELGKNTAQLLQKSALKKGVPPGYLASEILEKRLVEAV